MTTNLIADFIQAGVLGAAIYSVLMIWKRAALGWDGWFPSLKRAAQAVLWLALAIVLYYLIQVAQSELPNTMLGAAVILGFSVIPGAKLVLDRKMPAEKHERGAKIDSATHVAALVKKEKKKADIILGGVPIPVDTEPYHFMVAGSTGAGKSVAIRTMLDHIKDRGDTAIIVDSGGEFLTRYYNKDTDHILNPFDDRCVSWSPTAELEGPWDAESLARSIVPNGTADMKEWNGYAQTFLTAVLQKLFEQRRTSLRDLLWTVQAASIEELKPLLSGTPAAAQLQSDKTFGSIRTIASNYLSAYNYLADGASDFSVAKFIREAKDSFLYLTYRDDQLDSLRNLLSCVLDVAARTILSLPPDPNRRVWLVIDEFASIGKVQSIEAVATKARKCGGCLVIGVQSVSQLIDRYGENSAQSILACLSTWLVLRCTDPETAEYMSQYLGDAQVKKATEGKSSSDSGDSRSWNEQSSNQRVVMASEVQQLPNLKGFLKLAGHYPVCDVKLAFPPQYDPATAPFTLRDFDKKPMMQLQPTSVAAAEAATTAATAEAAPAEQPVRRKILIKRGGDGPAEG
jgi:type IV conjugative transfer system coupling protein TraD